MDTPIRNAHIVNCMAAIYGLLAISFLVGCSDPTTVQSGPYDSAARSIFVYDGDIYATGNDPALSSCFWTVTNTIWGTTIDETVLETSGYASSIYVYNGTVYTAGQDSDAQPCYWTDQNKTILPDGYDAQSIFVYNGTVYTAGGGYYTAPYHPCYWTGTVKTDLPEGGSPAWSIFVDNGIAYTAGSGSYTDPYYTVNGTTGHSYTAGAACYWQGTTRTVVCHVNMNNLINTSFIYMPNARSVFVYQNVVYTAGNDADKNACYWTGSEETIIGQGNPASLFVDNSGVYTAGVDENGCACYWIGTSKTTLDGSGSYAYSVFVYDNVIYVSGYDANHDACYWKGTVKVQLGIRDSGV